MKLLLTIVVFAYHFCTILSILRAQDNAFRETKNINGRWKFRLTVQGDSEIGFRQKWFQKSWNSISTSSGHAINPICPSLNLDVTITLWMPVPSSYNDVTQDARIRDFVGWVWYQSQDIPLPRGWNSRSDDRIYLRFGSVNYYAGVWVNDKFVGNHTGGHVPFQFDITDHVRNVDGSRVAGHVTISMVVNNTLHHGTIPPADLEQVDGDGSYYPKGFVRQTPLFDFFNYAGIHRSVDLYIVPRVHISDVTVQSFLPKNYQQSKVATVKFVVNITGHPRGDTTTSVSGCKVDIMEDSNYPDLSSPTQNSGLGRKVIAGDVLAYDPELSTCSGSIKIKDPELWWPVYMSDKPGYQYEAQISILSSSPSDINRDVMENTVEREKPSADRLPIDSYAQKFGIRSLDIHVDRFDNTTLLPTTTFLVNGRPFYFRGMGRHEDHVIRGRGFDWTLTLKDFNLISWLGANSFRTSHYPYAEEIMDLCDEMGIVVINECPGVGLRFFNNETLALHTTMMEELIQRDKNRPSTFLWSVANEPRSALASSEPYFKSLIERVRALDPTRFVTAALYETPHVDRIGKYLDVIGINRYFGWYEDTGHLDFIRMQMTHVLNSYRSTFEKPLIVTEYGSETIPGLHSDPPSVFTEEYQVDLIKEFHAAFDPFRKISNESGHKSMNRASESCFQNYAEPNEAKHQSLIGEMIWNFADFMTPQTITRALGNRKGIFTREGRYPKSSAFVLRQRYMSLAASDLKDTRA